MKYYQRVSATEVFVMFDGKQYANCNVKMMHYPRFVQLVSIDAGECRMMPVEFVRGDDAYIYIGKIGAAIAPICMPHSVSVFDDTHFGGGVS